VKSSRTIFKWVAAPFKWANASVQRKLMLGCILVLTIPLIITAVLMYQGAVTIVTEQTEKYNYKMLQLMNEKIDKLVTEIDRISYFVYLDDVQTMLNQIPTEPLSLASWQGTLKYKINTWIGFLGFNGGIRGVLLVDDKDVYFNLENIHLKNEALIQDTAWYKEAMGSSGVKIMMGPTEIGEHIVVNPYREGSLNFAIARKVHNEIDSQPLGVLVMIIEMYDMKKIMSELNIDNSTKLVITDKHNEIIYTNMHEDSKLTTGFSRWDSLNGAALETIDDETVLVNTYKSATTNWSYITLTDLRTLTSNAKKMNGLIVLIGLFGYALAVAMSFALSKRIVIPLKRLQVSMKNIERNEFRTEIAIGHTDEIGQLTVSFNHMVHRIRELINSVYLANIKEKEAQISALQAQINPHFLYNTLDTVNAMAMLEEHDSISRMIVALGEMFKYATNQNDKLVTLRDELEHLENYMTIQKCRFGDRIQFSNEIPEWILNNSMIRLTLQPLVENAIQHGLEPIAEGGTIRLFAVKELDKIRIQIEDDGRGVPADTLKRIQQQLRYSVYDSEAHRGRGIGLFNVNERLKLYFGEQYGISMQSEFGQGTSVSILIPSMENAEGALL
jgi:two-component system sensor histidine kinase YesM